MIRPNWSSSSIQVKGRGSLFFLALLCTCVNPPPLLQQLLCLPDYLVKAEPMHQSRRKWHFLFGQVEQKLSCRLSEFIRGQGCTRKHIRNTTWRGPSFRENSPSKVVWLSVSQKAQDHSYSLWVSPHVIPGFGFADGRTVDVWCLWSPSGVFPRASDNCRWRSQSCPSPTWLPPPSIA